MHEWSADWAKDVKCALIKRDLRQSELAERLNVSRVHLSYTINGFNPSKVLMARIDQYLGIDR